MDHKLKLFILACMITGSFSILCEFCVDNMEFLDFLPIGFGNCSAPAILNCTAFMDEVCPPGIPDYENCTRDNIPGCSKVNSVFTDANGTQQSGQFRSCAFSRSTDSQVCGQDMCDGAQSSFNGTNSTYTLVSCAAECCFNDTCNQGAAPPISTVTPTASAETTGQTNTSLHNNTTPTTSPHTTNYTQNTTSYVQNATTTGPTATSLHTHHTHAPSTTSPHTANYTQNTTTGLTATSLHANATPTPHTTNYTATTLHTHHTHAPSTTPPHTTNYTQNTTSQGQATTTGPTATTLHTHHTHNTTSHVHGTSPPALQVSHPYLVSLLWLGVVSLL